MGSRSIRETGKLDPWPPHQGRGQCFTARLPSTATFPFPRDLGAGLAVPQDPKQPGLSGSPLISMARRRPTAPWCPCSPCRSPSLEKGFYYTSESVSSGLKLDPGGLGCIWALFFVGPKVADLRNACCLRLSQIKTRMLRVRVVTNLERRPGGHHSLGAQPGRERT